MIAGREPRVAWIAAAALALLVSSCSSKGQGPSAHAMRISPGPNADLDACSRTLEQLDPKAADPYSSLLRAAIEHRLYELDAVKAYRGGDDLLRARLWGVGTLVGTTGDPPDLLAQSFRVVAGLRAQSGAIDDANVTDWIRVEKELIVADFLRREAGGGASPLSLRCVAEVPTELVDLIVRAEGAAMAARFYSKAATLAKDLKLADPRGAAGVLASLSEVRAAAGRLATWPGRDPAFTEMWEAVFSWTADFERSVSSPGDPQIVYHFDVGEHLKAGRELLLRAEEERMSGKTARSLSALEEGLRHLLFGWFLAPPEVRADRDKVVLWLDTAFSSLQRLTWTGEERELIDCAEKLPTPGSAPASPGERLRLAALLRRLHATGPEEVLQNVGEETRRRCARVAEVLAPPGPLGRAGTLAAAAWREKGDDGVSAEDRVQAVLVLSDALIERAPPGADAPIVDRVCRVGTLRAGVIVARRALAAFVRSEGRGSPAALLAIRRAARELGHAAVKLRGDTALPSGLDRVLDDTRVECQRLDSTPETPLPPGDAAWKQTCEGWIREGDAALSAARVEGAAPVTRMDCLLTAEGAYAAAATLRGFLGEAAGPEAQGERAVRGALSEER